ncbi:hypothetical protein [Streptomyces sp. ODS28]|uniref:hypothetical protein n=1 Tax=Streptomyces sp. ODS28 TaxID=3136688 RepID=UPI0031E75029
MTAGADLRLLRAAVFTAACVALSAAGHAVAGGCGIAPWALGAGFAMVFAVAAPLAGRERSLPGIAALLTVGQLGLHLLFSAGGAGQARPVRGTGQSPVMELAARMLCSKHASGPLTEARAHQVVSDAGISPDQAAALTGRAAHGGHGAGAGAGAAQAAHDAAGGPVVECLRQAARTALSLMDGPMLLGHLLAALALGVLLRCGEAALWRLVRLSALAELPVLPVHRLLPGRALRAALGYERALRAGLLPRAPARVTRALSYEDSAHPPSVLLDHSVRRRGPPRSAGELVLAV